MENPRPYKRGDNLTKEMKARGGQNGSRKGVPNGSSRKIMAAKKTFDALEFDPLKHAIELVKDPESEMSPKDRFEALMKLANFSHSKAPVKSETKKKGGKYDGMTDEEIMKKLKESGADIPSELFGSLKVVK